MSSTHGTNAANYDEARDRPFDANVVKRAATLAARYHIKIRQSQNIFLGTVSELPAVLGHGASEAAALAATRELLKWTIAYLIESGRMPMLDA